MTAIDGRFGFVSVDNDFTLGPSSYSLPSKVNFPATYGTIETIGSSDIILNINSGLRLTTHNQFKTINDQPRKKQKGGGISEPGIAVQQTDTTFGDVNHDPAHSLKSELDKNSAAYYAY